MKLRIVLSKEVEDEENAQQVFNIVQEWIDQFADIEIKATLTQPINSVEPE